MPWWAALAGVAVLHGKEFPSTISRGNFEGGCAIRNAPFGTIPVLISVKGRGTNRFGCGCRSNLREDSRWDGQSCELKERATLPVPHDYLTFALVYDATTFQSSKKSFVCERTQVVETSN